MTDRVVYKTEDNPIYVIQFETENGDWEDSSDPKFRSRTTAIEHLNKKTAAPYPYRIVERRV